MSKRGPPLNGQSRGLILKLHEYFERESANGGPLTEVTKVQERVAQALGIGTKTVGKILKEKYGPSGTEDNILQTPTKKRRKNKPITGIDSFDSEAIRDHIYGYYNRQEHLTISKLLMSLKEEGLFIGKSTSLKTVLKTMGFEFKKIDNNEILMERGNMYE